MSSRLRERRRPILVGGVWAIGTVLALVATLQSLAHTDFDGLNNAFQIPFAMPWFLLPIGGTDHVVNAWVAAAFGLANSGFIFLWLALRQRSERPN